MKNKGMFIVISSSIILVIISILYVFSLRNFDNKLLNNKWYHYDNKTGYADEFSFKNGELIFNKPSNDSTTDEYSYCNNYRYNRSTNKITFNCGKTIIIRDGNNNSIRVTINSDEYYFFKSLNESRNYEFKQYFDKNIRDYKNSKEQTLDIIKINYDKLNELLKESDYSKIIFIGDNCGSIECTLVTDIIEKWISYSKDIYYINSNELTKDNLTNLNKKDNNFSLNIDDYNSVYPIVYVISDEKIIDKYEIICSGFNCSLYYNK